MVRVVSARRAVAGLRAPAVAGPSATSVAHWAALPPGASGTRHSVGTRHSAGKGNPRRKDWDTGSPMDSSRRGNNNIRTTGRPPLTRQERSIASGISLSSPPRFREIRPALFEKGMDTFDEFFRRGAGRKAFGLAPQ